MDFSASASAMQVISYATAPLVLSTWVSGFVATKAVRGSHQRWLWGGIYRLGMVAAMIYNAALAVRALVAGDVVPMILHTLFFVFWVWAWRHWAKNSDDDFWNSLGKKVKKWASAAASSVRPAGSLAGQRG